MNKSGWDARRRNRNIGTEKSGHGQNNRLTIPQAWAYDRLYHEKLKNPVRLACEIGGNSLTILVEPTLPGFFHACTPSDIEAVLRLIPATHLEPIEMIVLRQPKRKEQILCPVWGRLQYWSNIEEYSGPAVHLEAQEIGGTYRWDKSLTPDGALELDRIKRDGHQINTDRRFHYSTGDLSAVRCTQLYRTLAHEIGHYVDYLEKVEKPAGDDYAEWNRLNELYHSRPSREKEDFAHRYATEFFEQQALDGNLPFERLFDLKLLSERGLDPAWFSDETV